MLKDHENYLKIIGNGALCGFAVYGTLVIGVGMFCMGVQHGPNPFPKSLQNLSFGTWCLWAYAVLPAIFAASGILMASAYCAGDYIYNRYNNSMKSTNPGSESVQIKTQSQEPSARPSSNLDSPLPPSNTTRGVIQS